MKAYSYLESSCFVSTIKDEVGHEVITDLSVEEGGGATAASALELMVMSLAGCITTLFAIVAKNSRLEYRDIDVQVDASKEPRSTINQAKALVKVKSSEDEEKVQRVFEKALKICPVGVLFEKAGVHVEHELTIVRD